MLPGLVIPEVNGLVKLGRALCIGANDEIISAAVLSHDKRVWRKSAPIAHPRRLTNNVVARSGKSLAVARIDKRDQLPTITCYLYLTTVVLCKTRLQAKRKRETRLYLGLCDLRNCDGEWHTRLWQR